MSAGSFMMAAQEYEQTHTHAQMPQVPRSQPRPIGDGTRRNSMPPAIQMSRPQVVQPQAKRPQATQPQVAQPQVALPRVEQSQVAQPQPERQAKRPRVEQPEAKRPQTTQPQEKNPKVQTATRLVPLYQEGGYFNFNLSASSVNGFHPRDGNDVELYDDNFDVEEAPKQGFPIKFQTDRSLKGKCKCCYVLTAMFVAMAFVICTYALYQIRESVNEIYASDKTLTSDNFPYEYLALIFIGVMALYCAIFTFALERMRPKSEYEVIQ